MDDNTIEFVTPNEPKTLLADRMNMRLHERQRQIRRRDDVLSNLDAINLRIAQIDQEVRDLEDAIELLDK